MGPLVGVTVPTLALGIARNHRTRWWYVIQFFAGFCLVANGAYIAFGSINRNGDAGDMLQHGTPAMLLWLFGTITILLGLWLSHGLGPHFGLGDARGQVDPRAAYGITVFVLAVIVAEILFS